MQGTVSCGLVRVLDRIPVANPADATDAPDAGSSHAPYKVYNIGNHEPVELMAFIQTIENALGMQASKRFLPMQPGDVVATCADVAELRRDIGFEPSTNLADGIASWVHWYRSHTGA